MGFDIDRAVRNLDQEEEGYYRLYFVEQARLIKICLGSGELIQRACS